MGTVKALMRDIVRRQLSFLGHVLRKDKLEKLVVTGFVGRQTTQRPTTRDLSHLPWQDDTEIDNGTVTNG